MTTVLLIAIPLIALGLLIVAGLCLDARRGDEALERDQCDALLGLRARDDLQFRPTGIQILGYPEDDSR